MNKIRPQNIVVLSGGKSHEREVSLKSGKRVCEALCGLGYRVALLDPISEYSLAKECFFEAYSEVVAFDARYGASQNEPSLPSAPLHTQKAQDITDSVLELCKRADKVFLALHGGAGENGIIAAVLEANSIAHTGSDFLGCAVAMDKLIAKRLLEGAGILTPLYTVYKCKSSSSRQASFGNLPRDRTLITQCSAPRYPCIVKPVSTGSSIGVKKVRSPSELEESLRIAASFGSDVLIEELIRGREFTVGILNGKALSITEIRPKTGFYDYQSKYTSQMTDEITPAILPPETERRLKRLALRTHNALSLGYYSRVDIILSAYSELPYVLEANSLPGMTALSLLPQGAAASGISFNELCEAILLETNKPSTLKRAP